MPQADEHAEQPRSTAAAVPDPQNHLSDYLVSLQSALQPLTQSAALLPNHADLAFHKSIDRKLAPKLDQQADRILESISTLSNWIAQHPQAPKPPADRIQHSHLTPDAFPRAIADLVDHLLENADTCIDEYTGKVAPRTSKHSNLASANAARFTIGALPKNGPLPAKILNAPIPPPQRAFATKPDNRAGVPWSRPLKLGKPHAQLPLGAPLPSDAEGGQQAVRTPRRGMYCAEGDPRDNPYHFEIINSQPPATCYDRPQPVAPPPLDPEDPSASTPESPYVWVDTAEKLQQLLDHLVEDRVQEIAIDLEHHNYRTYQGIVCLMQLSTRWGDWIVDTLSNEIREHSESLNRAFADPRKVKVLHGANHDVLWLQRDLGLYLVNLFDTYHATNILNFAGHGLGYLMQRYCDFDADKRYQLADWRIRPLPKEMLYYARSDTHSLLYIYDCLRCEMLDSPPGGGSGTSGGPAAIREVFELSKNVATAVYAKEDWDEDGEGRDGWRALWRKWGREAAEGSENRRRPEDMHKEERLVRRLHQWRDAVAREEDESPHYVLRAASLMMLASRAPTTVPGVVASFSPAVPALRKRAPELAQLIRDEVEAWEKDVRKKERRIAEGLEDGGAADADAGSDLGQAITRPSSRAANAAAVAAADEPISAVSAAAASDTTHGVNAALWPSVNGGSASPSRPSSIVSTSSKATQSLTSALFGAAASNGSSSNDAGRKKVGPKPLTSLGAVGGPSLFSLPPAGAQPGRDARGVVAALTSQFAIDVAPVLRRSGTVSLNTPLSSAEGEEQTRLAEPETVPFVPASQRHTIGGGTDERMPKVEKDSEKEEEEVEEMTVDVKAGGKKRKKEKQRWTKEQKRARDAAGASASGGGGGEGEGPPSSSSAVIAAGEDDTATTAGAGGNKRRKLASSTTAAAVESESTSPSPSKPTTGSGGVARKRQEATYDFSTPSSSLLFQDSPSSFSGGKGKKKKKGGAKKDRDGGGGGPEEQRGDDEGGAGTWRAAPKKKNEIRGAGRSGTFAARR